MTLPGLKLSGTLSCWWWLGISSLEDTRASLLLQSDHKELLTLFITFCQREGNEFADDAKLGACINHQSAQG